MAAYKFEVEIGPQYKHPHGRTEVVEAFDVTTKDGWTYFSDGSGLVKQLPAKDIVAITRKA